MPLQAYEVKNQKQTKNGPQVFTATVFTAQSATKEKEGSFDSKKKREGEDPFKQIFHSKMTNMYKSFLDQDSREQKSGAVTGNQASSYVSSVKNSDRFTLSSPKEDTKREKKKL